MWQSDEVTATHGTKQSYFPSLSFFKDKLQKSLKVSLLNFFPAAEEESGSETRLWERRRRWYPGSRCRSCWIRNVLCCPTLGTFKCNSSIWMKVHTKHPKVFKISMKNNKNKINNIPYKITTWKNTVQLSEIQISCFFILVYIMFMCTAHQGVQFRNTSSRAVNMLGLLGAVKVLESDSCWQEGSELTLLNAPGCSFRPGLGIGSGDAEQLDPGSKRFPPHRGWSLKSLKGFCSSSVRSEPILLLKMLLLFVFVDF